MEQKNMLDWGKGFLSKQDCQTVENRKICRTVTPGSTIEGALNDALGNPSKRIAVADEINEIVVALFSQLVTQAFSGAGGLLGLTPASGSSASQNTYFADLNRETADANSETSETIATAITHETTYRNLIQSTVTWINSAATYKVDTYGNDTCHSGALTPELTNARLVAESKLAQSNASLTALNALSARYNAAIGLPNQLDIQSKVMEEFSALAGKIHGESEIEEEQEIFIPQVNTVRSDFIASIDSVCPTNRSGGNGL